MPKKMPVKESSKSINVSGEEIGEPINRLTTFASFG